MVGPNLRLKLVSLSFLMVLMITGVSAAEPSVQVSSEDKVVWTNGGAEPVLDVNAYCEVQETDGEKTTTSKEEPDELYIWSDQEEEDILSNSDGSDGTSYSLNISDTDLETGSYVVVAECGTAQATDEFEVDRLDLEITDSSVDLFMGDNFEIDIEVSSEMGNFDLGNMEYPSMSLKPEDGEYSSFNDDEGVKGEEMTLKSDKAIPTDFISSNDGSGKIKVEASYGEEESNLPSDFEISDSVDVSLSRWDVDAEVIPGKKISYKDLGSVNISASMMYEGDALTPPRSDVSYEGYFYLERAEGKKDPGNYEWFSGGFTSESEDGKYGDYMLKLEKIPQLEVGRHTLEVWFYDGDERIHVTDVEVENKFTFDGTVSNSNSMAVDTEFTLDSEDYFEEFSTNSRGEFSRRVLPDDYGFDVMFPKGEIHLNEVEMQEDITGNVNYDYFKNPGDMELDLDGIKPVNMMTLSFGYPFSDGHAEMDYNPAKIDDPMQAKVFECKNWNFWARDCISGWDRINDEDVTLQSNRWSARFPVTPVETDEYDTTKKILLSAYVVGTNSALDVSRLSFSDYKVAAGSVTDISGTVTSDSGPVGEADVEIALTRDGEEAETSTGTTDSDGNFEVGISAPDKGNYSLSLSAQKDPYTSYQEDVDEEIWVFKEKELDMELPTQVDLAPGETGEAELTVKNSGQTEFNDIKVSAEGPEEAEFSFSEESISSLDAGKSETVTMSISLPEDFCSPSCAQYPKFDISLDAETDGETVEKEFELHSMVEQSQSSSGTENDNDSQEDDQTEIEQNNSSAGPLGMFSGYNLGMEDPTGEFLQSQGTLNIALGLIMVFTLALAGAIKKKKDDGGSSSRRARLEPSRSVSVHKPKVEPAEAAVEEGDEKINQIAEALDEDEASEEEGNVDELADKIGEQESEEDVDKKIEDAIDEISEEDLKDGADEEVEGNDSDGEAQQNLSCDICGEEFDTESGLKLHKQALH